MKLHYYGVLDSLESCYTFQTFDVEGVRVYIQNSPRFGYEPATMEIKNPALFIEKDGEYYRFVIEDFKIKVVDGVIDIEDTLVSEMVEKASQFIN